CVHSAECGQSNTHTDSTSTYNHYSILSTLESALGLASLTTNDGSAAPMSDFYSSTASAGCAAANLSASPSIAPPGSMFSLSASATTCPQPQYEFWLKQASGSWAVTQGWGGGVYNWNSSGLPAGTYQLGVWARQAGATSSYDAYGITTGTIAVDGCVGPNLAPSSAPPQAKGAKARFTAPSTGCASPQ